MRKCPECSGTAPELTVQNKPVEVLTAELRQTLEKVVESHLMSDVPLGVFLSGGLDSSITTALARQMIGEPIHSFSVGTEGCHDLEAARMLRRYLTDAPIVIKFKDVIDVRVGKWHTSRNPFVSYMITV